MVSLQDFSNYPKPGEISLYEKDGQLCSLPASEVDLTNFAGINVHIYEYYFGRRIHQDLNDFFVFSYLRTLTSTSAGSYAIIRQRPMTIIKLF